MDPQMSTCSELVLAVNEFTPSEILELERLYVEKGEQSLDVEACQDLASSFSCSSTRTGKPSVTWEQVQNWFLNKHKESSSPSSLKLFVDLSHAPKSPNGCQIKSDSTGDVIPDLTELAFEARSAKDGAWYDVASFQSFRVVSSGELEIRVRFVGYGHEQDEWLNVRRAVRERSIPLEPSDCEKVKVGDLVLCFQEREDCAVYCDARVVDIQRILHDVGECMCTFIVCYDHDNTKEKVDWNKLCRRPIGPVQEEHQLTMAATLECLWG